MSTAAGYPVQEKAENFEEFWARSVNDPIYVILGVQGAGTNLLSRLLRRTFGVSVLRDQSAVFNIAAELGPTPSPSEVRHAFGRVQRWIARWQRRRGVSLPFQGLGEAFDIVRPTNGAELARLVYAYRAFMFGARLMAIKSDDLWASIAHIDTVLPNRRIVLLTRDFRDNLVSVTGKHFGPIEPVCAALYVRHRFRLYEQEYHRAGVSGYHVRFEDVLSEPGRCLEELGRFFGWAPRVDPHDVGSTFRRRPNKIGKFRALSTRKRKWCEALLRDELVRWGYALEFDAADPPNLAMRLGLRLTDAVRRVPQKIRTMYARLTA